MKSREDGFTIIEALVAFAILAAMLSALYVAAGGSLRIAARGDRQQQAALLAQSKLDEISSVRGALPEMQQGTFPASDVGWRVEAHDIENGKASLRSLRLQSVRLTLSAPGVPPVVVETRHLGALRRE